MATGSMPIRSTASSHIATTSVQETAWEFLRALGSLKITVVMFLAANFLLFVGTLAQDEKSLPEVKAEYFNCWVAQVPFSDFFPVIPSFLRTRDPHLSQTYQISFLNADLPPLSLDRLSAFVHPFVSTIRRY